MCRRGASARRRCSGSPSTRRRQGVTLLEAARNVEAISTISKRPAACVKGFVSLIDRLSREVEAPLEEMLGLVLTETGYLEQLKASNYAEDLDRAANLEELLTAAREFDEQYEEDGGLEAFLEQTALVNDTDNWDGRSQQGHADDTACRQRIGVPGRVHRGRRAETAAA